MTAPVVAIVGAGHAGGRVAQQLCEKGFAGRILLIGEEPHLPYERPALSKELLLGTRSVDDILLAPADYWAGAVQVERIHARVLELDAQARELLLSNGQSVTFEQLVIATGGAPRRLRVPGGDLPGLHYLRTIDDCARLRDALGRARSLAIIGAGVIGMEAAASARRIGLDVTVIEAGARIMARCVPAPVSEWLAQEHRKQGVTLLMNASLESIALDADGRYRIAVRDGDDAPRQLSADAVLVAVGIECETGFADQAGVLVDNGVVVDQYCRSLNTPWCYAVGDVACTYVPELNRHVRQETWRNAENQAVAVAEFILGRTEPFRETPWMWTDQYDHNIQVVGAPHPDDEILARGEIDTGKATLLHLRDGRVVGGVMLNQGRDRKPLEILAEGSARIDRARLADAAVPLKQVAP